MTAATVGTHEIESMHLKTWLWSTPVLQKTTCELGGTHFGKARCGAFAWELRVCEAVSPKLVSTSYTSRPFEITTTVL
jgi:hypothetical protein